MGIKKLFAAGAAASLVLATFISLAVGIGWPGMALADVNNFTITDFTADYYPTNKDSQGEMRVVEKISVTYTDNNHGIERAIPLSYKDRSVDLSVTSVSSDTGAPATYTMRKENGNQVLRIGDASKTVTGDQEYNIEYTVKNVIGFYEGSPELYWDINGDQWAQPTEHVLARFHLPDSLKLNSDKTKQMQCYAGRTGTTEKNCTIAEDKGIVYAETVKPLRPKATMTVVVGFDGQNKYFASETATEKAARTWKPIAAFIVAPLLAAGYGLFAWLRGGRDPKGRGTIIPQYDAPDGMSPLEVGTVIDFKVDNRDITAVIISLAVRKYLKIIEERKNHWIGKDTLSYQLELVQADFSKLDSDEQVLLKGLFPEAKVGAKIAMKSAGSSLFKVASTLREQVTERLTTKGYFVSNPGKLGKHILIFSAIIVVATLAAVFGLSVGPAIGGAVLSLVIAIIFTLIMPARTSKGVAAVEHAEGLKMFLKTAEAERIKKLQAPNAAYAENNKEPVHTVDLFEKLLPYAVVLGVEKDWAKQFDNLYQKPPEWYSGDYSSFTAGFLVGSLHDNFQGAVANTFTSPSSSSGSGFSGGSSGGGGGGGGGGW